MQHDIRFFAADVNIPIKNRTALKNFISEQINKQRGKNYFYQLNVICCSDEYLLQINRQFLNHDYYTDIITFPLTNTPKELMAEIYISIERIKENAQHIENQKNKPVSSFFKLSPFQKELHRVIFHGVLHLLDHNDKTPQQKLAMRQAEDAWLASYQKYLMKLSKK